MTVPDRPWLGGPPGPPGAGAPCGHPGCAGAPGGGASGCWFISIVPLNFGAEAPFRLNPHFVHVDAASEFCVPQFGQNTHHLRQQSLANCAYCPRNRAMLNGLTRGFDRPRHAHAPAAWSEWAGRVNEGRPVPQVKARAPVRAALTRALASRRFRAPERRRNDGRAMSSRGALQGRAGSRRREPVEMRGLFLEPR